MKQDPVPATGTPVFGDLPVHEAEALTAGTGRALIRLGGETWVLRITRAGKLILTK